MRHRITTQFLQTITAEKDHFWLWIPVCIALGIMLSFASSANMILYYSAIVILAVAFILWYCDRFSYRCFIYAIAALVMVGFLWSECYQQFFILDKKITGTLFADIEGEVVEIKRYEDSKSISLVIANPVLYKADFSKSNTKTKPVRKPKMIKKFRIMLQECGHDVACISNVHQLSDRHEEQKRIRREKRRKARKPSEKQIRNSFLNVAEYQEINREFLSLKSSYQQVQWRDYNGRKVFPNPPTKISISVKPLDHLEIGDRIALRAMLEPASGKEFIDGFDYSFYLDSKEIGAKGRSIGEASIIKKTQYSSFDDYMSHIRQVVSSKINMHLSGDNQAVAAALMVGVRDAISSQTMDQIRQSGLAHLLAISGLHMAIAATIFFFSSRFLLSRSQYITLRYDIKKIAAIAAIISAYFYLQLAGSPVPATRSFIMVALVLTAVLIDRKTDLKRSIALAALLLMLVNPYHIFLASFQFSFAAILSLACFHHFMSGLKPDSVSASLPQTFLWYFTEIALASIIVQIATAPFLIYHFRNFSTYGLFANMLAIPLTSFVTMPLGFLSLALMPFGLEKLALEAMGIAISWTLNISHFIASLPYAYFVTPHMPKLAFILAVTSFLIICLSKSRLRWWLSLVFIASFLSLFFVKKPNISFDSQQKFFTIYDQKDGLVFSKKLRPSRKRDIWMKEFGETNFKYLQQFPHKRDITCDDKTCEVKNQNGKILIILSRNEISKICDKHDYKIIVNLNSKYKLPQCFNTQHQVIDSYDFHHKGGHFIYFTKEGFDIKSAR